MGRARRATRIAQAAAYGGGFGVAGIGALGALGYGVIKVEARLARRIVGQPFDGAPDDDGLYGAGLGDPIELLVLGDSTAAGLGADSPMQTSGAFLAGGLSAFAGRQVRLTNVAVVGAESSGLEVQVVNALDTVPRPDAAVILVGANDVTHRIDKAIAVRHLANAVRRLRAAGAEVVVGTCPDLGAIEPVAQPLRLLARRWSRDLAAAQTVAVVEAGGRTVSLGDLLGPEFARSPEEMFAKDRFHPSSAGYARAASAMLPSVCVALGLWEETAGGAPDWRRGDTVGPVSRTASAAVAVPGTEVSATEVGGTSRGPRGRWAIGLRRVRRPVPERTSRTERSQDAVRGEDGVPPTPSEHTGPGPAPTTPTHGSGGAATGLVGTSAVAAEQVPGT